MAHMILGSIVHWRHYHQTFKSMRLGGLVIVQWRISSPGIYMVFPLISPLFLFLILTVQLLVKVSSVQPVEHSARVLTKDLSLVPTAASLGTWHSEVRVGGMPYLKQMQLQCACWPLGQGQCIAILAGCLPNVAVGRIHQQIPTILGAKFLKINDIHKSSRLYIFNLFSSLEPSIYTFDNSF